MGPRRSADSSTHRTEFGTLGWTVSPVSSPVRNVNPGTTTKRVKNDGGFAITKWPGQGALLWPGHP
jgi:hypothetical protein